MADRLAWTDGQLHVGEVLITTQNGVSINDGNEKVRRDFSENIHTSIDSSFQTDYQKGTITLTTHRILWKDASSQVIKLLTINLNEWRFLLDRIATVCYYI